MASKYRFFIDEFRDYGLIAKVFEENIEDYLDTVSRYLRQNTRNKTGLKLDIWKMYYDSSKPKDYVAHHFGITKSTTHHHIESVNYVLRHLPDFSEMWK